MAVVYRESEKHGGAHVNLPPSEIIYRYEIYAPTLEAIGERIVEHLASIKQALTDFDTHLNTTIDEEITQLASAVEAVVTSEAEKEEVLAKIATMRMNIGSKIAGMVPDTPPPTP